MKKFLLIIILLAVSLAYSATADTATNKQANPFVYLFHLYYDNGQLFADRDVEFKYDLIAEPYAPLAVNQAAAYKGEVVNLLGKVEGAFSFNPALTKGKILVKGPYFSDADKVNFYNPQGKLLLTIPVGDSSVCNDNGRCESDVGEDFYNCPNDCKLKPAPSGAPGLPPAGGLTGGKIALIVIMILIIAIVLFLVWFIIRKKRVGSNNKPPLPPATPQTPLPPQPVPPTLPAAPNQSPPRQPTP